MGAEGLRILMAYGRLSVLHQGAIFSSRRKLIEIVELPLEINLLHLASDVSKHLSIPDRLVVFRDTL